MSTLRVNSLANSGGTGNINIAAGNSLIIPGSVIQTVYIRTDARSTYSSINSGNGVTVTDLNITITPRLSTSRLIMQWMINGEMHQDNTFLIHRNGSLITDTGVTGFNSAVGNIRSSGYASGFYDQNEDSTPSNWFIQYSIISGSTSSVTYAPAVRSSSGGNYTFAINRTIAASTGDSYESMVSTGVCWEVAV